MKKNRNIRPICVECIMKNYMNFALRASSSFFLRASSSFRLRAAVCSSTYSAAYVNKTKNKNVPPLIPITCSTVRDSRLNAGVRLFIPYVGCLRVDGGVTSTVASGDGVTSMTDSVGDGEFIVDSDDDDGVFPDADDDSDDDIFSDDGDASEDGVFPDGDGDSAVGEGLSTVVEFTVYAVVVVFTVDIVVVVVVNIAVVVVGVVVITQYVCVVG